MISSKELPLLCMIVGGFVIVFLLMCLPGIVTSDSLSHQLGHSEKSMMFNRDGTIKDSIWSWDSTVGGDNPSDTVYRPRRVAEGDLQANPFAE